MHSRHLIRIRTLLEFGIDPDGDLCPFRWMDRHDVPRLSVFRHDLGHVVYFRHDVPQRVRQEFELLGPEVAFGSPQRVRDALGSAASQAQPQFTTHYILGRAELTDTSRVMRHGNHFLTFEAEHPVSWAWTVREHAVAEEGSVETVEGFRRRGHGRRVLASWAKFVREQGKLPVLDVEKGDLPAMGLATSVGGTCFAESVTFR